MIIERNVPFMDALEAVADVKYLPYGEITPMAVADARALVVRTRNRCDASLLEGSDVTLVATATIGTDHIDLPWCAAHGIEVANAPGSNAPAVAQYVFSSIARLINRPVSNYTIGIVGVGHVGSIVERWARSLDMKVMLCDPPRQRAEGGDMWHTLAEIAERADIITFHTPLTKEGPDATYRLADEKFFNFLRRAPIIINTARGAVVDNDAWVRAINAGVAGKAVVDCWEGEPNINLDLLRLSAIATPHIAGYSFEGKQRASQMALDAVCRHLGLPSLKVSGPAPQSVARSITLRGALDSYNPLDDTAALRSAADTAPAFEALRNGYKLRPELDEKFSN